MNPKVEEKEMGEVSSIYKRTLVSSKLIKVGKKIPLSPLDLLMEKQHIKMLYYFATPKGMGVGEMTTRLRESLAEILSYFDNMTGRLMKDEKGNWIVKCNDAGIRVVEAIAKGSVQTWLDNLDEEKEMKLIHWEDMFHNPYFWATFYFKVTEFEEGGVALGLGCSHLLADPLSASLFVKAWADMALCGNVLVPPFFHPLPLGILSHKNQGYLINHYKSILESPSPSPNPSSSTTQDSMAIALSFTDEMVQDCMDLAQSNGPINGPNPTPFAALGGLLWTCISRVKGGTNCLIDMSLCIDARGKLGLDKGYFGNCMVYSQVEGHGIGVDDISKATKAIEEAIGKLDKEVIMDLIEWLANYEQLNLTSLPILQNGHNDNIVLVNLENMDSYSTMFVESYEPLRVSCYIEPFLGKGKVVVLPSHSHHQGNSSRVVMVTLPSHEATKLCQDELLYQFSPTILM